MAYAFGGRGDGPDVPWFTLPTPAFGPYTPPGPISSPYSGGIAGAGPNNPPPGAPTFPFHANITRFWPSPPTKYVVVIPNAVPALPGTPGTPNLSVTVVSTFGLTVAPNSPAASYNWGDWSKSVQAVFAKYSNVVTAECSANWVGDVYSPVPYNLVDGAGTISPSRFIWGTTAATPGPTGNGVNEIILTDQQIPGVGYTSMLVNPANGNIIECDVLFEVGSAAGLRRGLIQNYAGGTATTVPEEWTALDHEIGHFFGLDHTNLHNGVASPQVAPGNALPVPAGGFAPPTGTRTVFPGTVTQSAPEFPSMVGFITHLGPGVDATQIPMHNDDATGLSKIYPVLMPLPLNPKVPLINVSASIRGRCSLATTPVVGAFGRNVLAVNSTLTDAVGGYPLSGVISSTARVTDDPFTMLLDPAPPPSLPTPLALYRDTRTNTPYFPTASIPGTGGTGDFSIDGVIVSPTGIGGTPLSYDLIFEDSALLGVIAPTNQAEWFSPPAGGFYAGNRLDPQSGFPPPTVMTFGWNAVGVFQPPATSLSVVAGTVIYLNPAETGDSNIGMTTIPGSQSVIVPTGFGPKFREQAIRPLVSMTPRLGRFTAPSLVITVRNDHPSPNGYDTTTARLFAQIGTGPYNSVALPPITAPANGIITGPATSTWTIPMATVIGAASPTTPVRATFLIRSAPNSQTAPPVILDPSTSTAIVTDVGRNDVIL